MTEQAFARYQWGIDEAEPDLPPAMFVSDFRVSREDWERGRQRSAVADLALAHELARQRGAACLRNE